MYKLGISNFIKCCNGTVVSNNGKKVSHKQNPEQSFLVIYSIKTGNNKIYEKYDPMISNRSRKSVNPSMDPYGIFLENLFT